MKLSGRQEGRDRPWSRKSRGERVDGGRQTGRAAKVGLAYGGRTTAALRTRDGSSFFLFLCPSYPPSPPPLATRASPTKFRQDCVCPLPRMGRSVRLKATCISPPSSRPGFGQIFFKFFFLKKGINGPVGGYIRSTRIRSGQGRRAAS